LTHAMCAHSMSQQNFPSNKLFRKKKSMLWLKDRIKLEQIESAVSWKDLLKNIIREKFKIYPIKV
jgi:hypothetical protein